MHRLKPTCYCMLMLVQAEANMSLYVVVCAGEGENTLALEMDDVVEVMVKEGVWWYGALEERCGWFPAGVVEAMPTLEPEPDMEKKMVCW